MPVAVRFTVIGLFSASLVMVSVPAAGPTAAGANVMGSATVPLAGTVNGRDGTFAVKSPPVMATAVVVADPDLAGHRLERILPPGYPESH